MSTERYLKRIKLNKANHLLLEGMLQLKKAADTFMEAQLSERREMQRYDDEIRQLQRQMGVFFRCAMNADAPEYSRSRQHFQQLEQKLEELMHEQKSATLPPEYRLNMHAMNSQ